MGVGRAGAREGPQGSRVGPWPNGTSGCQHTASCLHKPHWQRRHAAPPGLPAPHLLQRDGQAVEALAHLLAAEREVGAVGRGRRVAEARRVQESGVRVRGPHACCGAPLRLLPTLGEPASKAPSHPPHRPTTLPPFPSAPTPTPTHHTHTYTHSLFLTRALSESQGRHRQKPGRRRPAGPAGGGPTRGSRGCRRKSCRAAPRRRACRPADRSTAGEE